MKTRRLVTNAVLSAMCAVLGMLSIDLGNLKLTFESFPILVSAALFGPSDAVMVSFIGTLCYQILRYGVSATTLLWIAPYVVYGLLIGTVFKRSGFKLSRKKIVLIALAGELVITILNTGVLYIDSLVYQYYSSVYVFGTLIPRLIICVCKGIVFGEILPAINKPLQKYLQKNSMRINSQLR